MKEQDYLNKFANFSEDLKDFRLLNTKLIIKLLAIIPREIFLVNVDFHLNENTPTLEIHGHADNSDNVFKLLSEMSKSDLFKGPKLKSTNEVEIDEERYFIRFVLTSEIDTEKLYPDYKPEEEEKDDEEDGEEEEEEEGE